MERRRVILQVIVGIVFFLGIWGVLGYLNWDSKDDDSALKNIVSQRDYIEVKDPDVSCRILLDTREVASEINVKDETPIEERNQKVIKCLLLRELPINEDNLKKYFAIDKPFCKFLRKRINEGKWTVDERIKLEQAYNQECKK